MSQPASDKSYPSNDAFPGMLLLSSKKFKTCNCKAGFCETDFCPCKANRGKCFHKCPC